MIMCIPLCMAVVLLIASLITNYWYNKKTNNKLKTEKND